MRPVNGLQIGRSALIVQLLMAAPGERFRLFFMEQPIVSCLIFQVCAGLPIFVLMIFEIQWRGHRRYCNIETSGGLKEYGKSILE
jgi:hypothetical protein